MIIVLYTLDLNESIFNNHCIFVIVTWFHPFLVEDFIASHYYLTLFPILVSLSDLRTNEILIDRIL